MGRRIEIVIPADGSEPQVEVHGVQGESCRGLTAAYEEAMGMTATTEAKPEFYQENQQDQQQEGWA